MRVPLNQAMRDASDEHGWSFVDDHVDDFTGHAICQSDRWINTNNDALRKQGELAASDPILQDYSGGWVHPNARGYSQMGGALYRRLAARLVARFTPVFDAPLLLREPSRPYDPGDVLHGWPGALQEERQLRRAEAAAGGCRRPQHPGHRSRRVPTAPLLPAEFAPFTTAPAAIW